jgi:hypothetical protein
MPNPDFGEDPETLEAIREEMEGRLKHSRRHRMTPIQALVSDMIERAWRDMIEQEATTERLSALAWLASSWAGVWFAGLGIDQQWFLEQIKWADHAEDFWARAKVQYRQHRWNFRHLRVTRRGIELYRRGIL